ncbi:hypothetical protein KCU68_g10140, partial [Aureobasidium melanogenum]
MSHSTLPDSNNALVQNAPPLAATKSTSPMPLEGPSVSSPPSAPQIPQKDVPESKNNDALDIENDSEAETLIVSPVKKRDMLKQSNSAQALESIDEIPEKNASQPEEILTQPVRGTSSDRAQTNGDKPQKDENPPAEKDIKLDEQDTKANGDNQDSDSDNLSEVSSVQSFEDENGNENEVNNNDNDEDDDEDEDARSWASDKDDEERASNPRKRKHADTPADRFSTISTAQPEPE